MTDTELRELDAEIAEKVMGWKHGHNHTYCDRPFVSCPVCLTRFSTDIAAAMSVADYLIAKGHGLDMQAWIPEQRNQGIWRVDFESSDEGNTVTHGFVYSDSLPEAICRAALKTIKVDV